MDIKNLEDIYDLTPLQYDNLKLYINAPNQGIFHENLLFIYAGEMDDTFFEKCWDKVVEKHSILRTAFFYRGLAKPYQVVQKKVTLPKNIFDFRDLSEAEEQKKIEEMMQNDRINDYDLEKAPLMRIALIKSRGNKFKLWWRFHHILMDGWSFTIALDDFFDYYRLYTNGNAPADSDTVNHSTHKFRDYIVHLKKRNTEKEKLFWKNYLDDYTPMEGLEIGPPPSGNSSSPTRQGRIDYNIAPLYEPLQNIIRKHGVTLNAVFQGLFVLLMSKYYGDPSDIVTGSTVADRPLNLPDAHKRVGLFVNTLPVRCRIDRGKSFLDWIKKIQPIMAETFQYSSSSEHDIKNWCGVPETQPLFECALIFKNMPLSEDPFAGLNFHMTGYNLESRPHYPLSLFVWPGEDLELKIIHDLHRFSEEAANQVLKEVHMGLETFIENPQKPTNEFYH